MPTLMPYDDAAWVAHAPLIAEGGGKVLRENLETLCVGKRWSKRMEVLLASKDDSHLRKLLFVGLAAPLFYFEQGQLYWEVPIGEVGDEDDYEELGEEPITTDKLLEASAKLLPAGIHEILRTGTVMLKVMLPVPTLGQALSTALIVTE